MVKIPIRVSKNLPTALLLYSGFPQYCPRIELYASNPIITNVAAKKMSVSIKIEFELQMYN